MHELTISFLISSFFSVCLWDLWCVTKTYQDTAIWQRGHVIDHNLLEWRTCGRNVSESIYCHLGGEREENMCVCWNQCSFPCSSYFQGPIKWNHTSGTKLMHIPRGRWVLCCSACVSCYGACTWWVGGPEFYKPNPPLRLATVAFLLSPSPWDLRSFALTECKQSPV